MDNKYKHNITRIAPKDCSGCGSCHNICPVDAITMPYDKQGFQASVVDEDKCTDCGQCLQHCPVIAPVYYNDPEPNCYAAYAEDEDIRAASSSGGIFTLLANAVFEKNGVVCGAAFRQDFTVEHIIIESKDELDKLRGSKYLQSDTGLVFRKIKSLLKDGRKVLYCSCPCQVAGLNSYLRRDYHNLLTIDLMCHGGPAPHLFKKYLKETFPDKKIQSYSFRDKSVFGWSTEANIYFDDGTSEHIVRSQDI